MQVPGKIQILPACAALPLASQAVAPASQPPLDPAVVLGAARPRDLADLRVLAQKAQQMQRASAAPAVATRPRLDIQDIPFGVEIELYGLNKTKATEAVKSLDTWNVNPKCSTWSVVDDSSIGGGSEAVSPAMVLRGGRAEQQIRKILTDLEALGGKATPTCGLHVHVDASKLDARALSNLMRMALDNEHVLFKLSQNGQAEHRTTKANAAQSGYQTCKPLSANIKDPFPVIAADSIDEFRDAFYAQMPPNTSRKLPPAGSEQPFTPDRKDPSRYFDVNFNSFWYRGTIEFRVFNATDDPTQLLDDVKLALGMVAAAANDDYASLDAQPVTPKEPNAPVSREAFEYFLSKTTQDEPTRERLRQTFTAGGGAFVEDRPVDDPHLLKIAALIEHGCKFSIADKPLTSPFAIKNELAAGRRAVTMNGVGNLSATTLRTVDDVDGAVHETAAEFEAAFAEARASGLNISADGQPVGTYTALRQAIEAHQSLTMGDTALTASQAEPLLLAVSGRWSSLPASLHQNFVDASALTQHQISLTDDRGHALTPAQAAVLAGSGTVQASHGGERIDIGGEGGLTLSQLRACCEPGFSPQGAEIPTALRTANESIAFLTDRGYHFSEADGPALRWRPAIAVSLLAGETLDMTAPDGGKTQLRSIDDLAAPVLAARAAALPDTQRQLYTRATQLGIQQHMVFQKGAQPLPHLTQQEFLALTSDDPGLRVSMPGLSASMPLPSRSHLQTLIAVAPVLPPPLAAVFAGELVPRLLGETERGALGVEGNSTLDGRLTIRDNSGHTSSYRTARTADGLTIDGEGTHLRVSLGDATPAGTPQLRLQPDGSEPLLIDTRCLPAPGAVSTFTPTAAATELWTVGVQPPTDNAPISGAEPAIEAVFERLPGSVTPSPAADPRAFIRQHGLFPARHFETVAPDPLKITGYRTTNEVTIAFPSFSLRGKAYIGVGSTQNYDHMTTAQSELGFLMDADPHVADDHRGFLALVSVASDPAEFLSKLFGTRLAPEQQQLPLPQLLAWFGSHSADKAYVEETKAALQQQLEPAEYEAAVKVMDAARGTFLGSWTTQSKEGQHLWLADPDRYSHLRWMQRAGRIVVRNGSLSGTDTLASIKSSLDNWNRTHYPPMTVNAIYTSNAEQWVNSGSNGQKAAYPQFVANITALPLHPEGVILRTGDASTGGVKYKSGSWVYDTMPMAQFVEAAKKSPTYAAINKASLGHTPALQAAEAARAQKVYDHFGTELTSGGWTIEGTISADNVASGKVTVRDAAGRPVPLANADILRYAASMAAGHNEDLPQPIRDVMASTDRLSAAGVTGVPNPLAAWQTFEQSQPLAIGNWSVPHSDQLRELAAVESQALAELPAEARTGIETLAAVRSLGYQLISHQAEGQTYAHTSLATARWALQAGTLSLVTPGGADLAVSHLDELQTMAALQRNDAAKTDAERGFLAEFGRLAAGGWSVQADGHTLGTPAEAWLALQRGKAQLKRGDGEALPVTREHGWRMICGQRTEEENQQFADIEHLMGSGVGVPVATADEALIRFPSLTFTLPFDNVQPNQIKANNSGELSELRFDVDSLHYLQSQGFTLQSGAGGGVGSVSRLTVVTPLGEAITLSGPDSLHQLCDSAPARLAAQQQRKASLESDAHSLREAGVSLGFTPTTDADGSLVRRWLGEVAPVRNDGVNLENPEELQMMARMQRRDADLPDAEKVHVRQFDLLSGHGWRFEAGGQPVTTAAGAWLALRRGALRFQSPNGQGTLALSPENWRMLSGSHGDEGAPLNDKQRQMLDDMRVLLEKGATPRLEPGLGGFAVRTPQEAVAAFPAVHFEFPHRVRWGLLWKHHIQPQDAHELSDLRHRVEK